MRIFALTSALLTVLSIAPSANAQWCVGARELAMEMDVRGVTSIEIQAVAGDLDIAGVPGIKQIQATGKACTKRRFRDRVDDIRIVEERDGGTLRIIADVPTSGRINSSLIGSLDLIITVPDDIPLNIMDSSGDIVTKNTGPITLTDSSGDIQLHGVKGDVSIEMDSSGDIEVRDAGNVQIYIDSSGDVDVRNALSLTVDKDSSGDIEASDITADVMVGTDSSGDIDVKDVGGNLTVRRDGSGDIRYQRVAGSIDVPRRKRD